MQGTNGIGTSLQIGKETTWGTAVAPTHSINFTDESFKQEPETLEEETLVGAICAGAQDIVGYKSSGGFGTVLKPEDAVILFALALGVQATPELVANATKTYKHVITPVDAITDLLSFTAIVDRKKQVKSYSGNYINTLELTAEAKNYLKTKVETILLSEADGTKVSTLVVPSKKAYVFANGQCLLDGTVFADITATTVKINNNVTEGDQTLGSGLYKSQGLHGEREFTWSATAKYTTDANTLIENKYKVGSTIAVQLTFLSPEVIETGFQHKIIISMPAVIMTGGLPNVSGKDEMKLSLAGKALQTSAAVSPFTVTIQTDIASSI